MVVVDELGPALAVCYEVGCSGGCDVCALEVDAVHAADYDVVC